MPFEPNPLAAIGLLSQRNPMLCDQAKSLGNAREIDNVDRIEGRGLLELTVDRRESGARDRGRAFYADVDVRALIGRAVARDPNRKTR
jgi:hypothetical protein